MAPLDFSGIFRAVLAAVLAAGATTYGQVPEKTEQAVTVAVPDYVVQPGSKIPLSLINSVSTKHSIEGDRVYLETVFPVLVNGKIVIPPGSYVAGTVAHVKRPGPVKRRADAFVCFHCLTLPKARPPAFRG